MQQFLFYDTVHLQVEKRKLRFLFEGNKRFMDMKKSFPLIIVSALLFLPACDWFGSKKSESSGSSQTGKGQPLLSLNGKVAIGSDDFEGYIDQISAENPQVKMYLQAMPSAKKNLFAGMVVEELLLSWAREKGLHNSDGYKKDYALAIRMLERQLIQKHFQEYLLDKVDVSDKDARDFYDENKTKIPALQSSPASGEGENKKEAKYHSFEDVKEGLIKMLESKKAEELFAKEVEALKSRYNAEEHEGYFKVEEPPATDDAQADASEETDAKPEKVTT